MDDMAHFNRDQMRAINIAQRVMSVASIVGSIFIISTFLKWPYFRKPINRLVFYASFGNLIVNAATFTGISALPADPLDLTLACEIQGILIQWFLAADCLWVFSMALNVQLVFFHKFTSEKLRRLEKWYILCSYGIPGATSIVYICLDHLTDTKVIGSATLWCWVSSNSGWMRIAFFYAPVWFVIFWTLGIYLVTGVKILREGSELRSISKKVEADKVAGKASRNRRASNSLAIQVETKMETHFEPENPQEPTRAFSRNESRCSFGSTLRLSTMPRSDRFTGSGGDQSIQNGYTYLDIGTGLSRTTIAANSAAKRGTYSTKINLAALRYFKVALLMFVALVSVWVPSTINRLQQFVHKGEPKFGLSLAAAVVLPLQGFWNSMIYVSTTWPECKRAAAELWVSISRNKRSGWSIGSSRNPIAQESSLEFGVAIPLEDLEHGNPVGRPQNLGTSGKKDLPSSNITSST